MVRISRINSVFWRARGISGSPGRVREAPENSEDNINNIIELLLAIRFRIIGNLWYTSASVVHMSRKKDAFLCLRGCL